MAKKKKKKKRVIKHIINWNYVATLFALLAAFTTILVISNEKEINILQKSLEYEISQKIKYEETQDIGLFKKLEKQKEYSKSLKTELAIRDSIIDSLETKLFKKNEDFYKEDKMSIKDSKDSILLFNFLDTDISQRKINRIIFLLILAFSIVMIIISRILHKKQKNSLD